MIIHPLILLLLYISYHFTNVYPTIPIFVVNDSTRNLLLKGTVCCDHKIPWRGANGFFLKVKIWLYIHTKYLIKDRFYILSINCTLLFSLLYLLYFIVCFLKNHQNYNTRFNENKVSTFLGRNASALINYLNWIRPGGIWIFIGEHFILLEEYCHPARSQNSYFYR